jgi:hypothetical protein
VASGAITRSMIGHETEMFLHYSHIERGEKHSSVEHAVALVDGPKVEGSGAAGDPPNSGHREKTLND